MGHRMCESLVVAAVIVADTSSTLMVFAVEDCDEPGEGTVRKRLGNGRSAPDRNGVGERERESSGFLRLA